MIVRARVNWDIGCSPFEMVYGYKPETTKSSQGLKLIKPTEKPKDQTPTQELIKVRSQASLKASQFIQEQAIKSTTQFEEGDKVWVKNPISQNFNPKN